MKKNINNSQKYLFFALWLTSLITKFIQNDVKFLLEYYILKCQILIIRLIVSLEKNRLPFSALMGDKGEVNVSMEWGKATLLATITSKGYSFPGRLSLIWPIYQLNCNKFGWRVWKYLYRDIVYKRNSKTSGHVLRFLRLRR